MIDVLHLADTEPWRKDAACATIGGDFWFPEIPGEHSVEALAICRNCPVKDACLQHAIDHDEDGIWAGTTRIQRLRMVGRWAS